tara:strand:+ start:96 stop:1871 length:1776 start_codon:yes stop_codon:yes gene_type:complete
MYSLKKYAFLVIFVSASSFDIKSDDLTLVVNGIGSTKANAIVDAQRNALRTSYGEFISTNLTTLNSQLTKNENINLVSGTIKKSKVISINENDFTVPPIIEALMEITVNKGQLVSFAKAIGDNIEIQGSLFGAELRLQEINKKNEVVAMNHLAKKAEIMNAFFDYEISVDSPKGSNIIEDDYFIYSSVSLKTNQNYKNLIMTVQNTLSQIAMTPSEIKKYDELNTPYYGLDLVEIKNPICTKLGLYIGGMEISPLGKYYDGDGRPGAFKYGEPVVLSDTIMHKSLRRQLNMLRTGLELGQLKNKSDVAKQRGVTITESEWRNLVNITCKLGEVNRIYLRAKDSYRSLEKVHAQVFKSILAYELFQQTKTKKKLIFPFQPKPTSSSFLNLSKSNVISINSFIDLNPNNGDFVRKPDAYDQYIEMIVRNQPQDDKNNINKECPKIRGLVFNGFCYKNTEFTDYAWEINKTYAEGEYSFEKYIQSAYYQPSGWISNQKYIEPLSMEEINSILQMREGREVYSRMHDVFLYIAPDKKHANPHLGLTQGGRPLLGLLLIYEEGFEFARLKFEDIVTRDELSNITGYIIDPDKKTKR